MKLTSAAAKNMWTLLKDIVSEVTWPARSLSCAITMLVFLVLLGLAASAGIFGLYLAVIVVPALFRYLVMVAEARAEGRDVDPPGIEFFSLASSLWTLFPVIPAFALGAAVWWGAGISLVLAWVIALVGLAVFAAMTGVLVITHSPVQSCNPFALHRMVTAVGWPMLLAPAFVLLAGALFVFVALLPTPFAWVFELYVAFAWFALVGGLIRSRDLLGEIDLPEDASLGEEQEHGERQRERTLVLNHAYGLASRGNRAGAFAHIEQCIGEDPSPEDAWPWFFARMLEWENRDHALFFGQRYLGRLLAQGETVRAVKLMMRCRMENDAFRPRPEDIAAAVAAARSCGNPDLAREFELSGTRQPV